MRRYSNNLLKLILFFVLCGFNSTFSVAQDTLIQGENLNSLVLNSVFSEYSTPIKKKRVLLNLSNEKVNFLTYMAAGMLFVYQNVISEQISANCTYEISCSEYTKKCIEKYGIIKGTFIGLHQLSCCVPKIEDDYCAHKISENGKIINVIE